MSKKLTKAQQEKALAAVARYLGPKMGHIKPCGTCASCKAGLRYAFECDNPKPVPAPTGDEAAAHGDGPVLVPAWDWPSSGPTPTIILEGGPYEWAIDISLNPTFVAEMAKIGVFAEPYAGYALCLYSDND